MIKYTECESNYVGIVLDKETNEITYYTSEYYKESNKFFLCSETKDIRYSYDIEIFTKDDFINNILK